MRKVVSIAAFAVAITGSVAAEEGNETLERIIQKAEKTYSPENAEKAMSNSQMMIPFAPPPTSSHIEMIRKIVREFDIDHDPYQIQFAGYDFDKDGDDDIFLKKNGNFIEDQEIVAFVRNADNMITPAGVIPSPSLLSSENPGKVIALDENDREYEYLYKDDRFQFDYSSIADELQMFEIPFEDVRNLFARDLKSQFLMMQSASAPSDKIIGGDVDLNSDGNPELILSIRHAAVCDNNMSCPLLIYQRDAKDRLSDGPFTQTVAQSAKIYVERNLRSGKMGDLFFEYDDEPHLLRWSTENSKYQLYEMF